MTFYAITGRYTSQGFADLRQHGAAALEQRLIQSVEQLGGKVHNLSFIGSTFDVRLVIEAPASVAAAVFLPMLTSNAFVPGAEISRLITPDEADLTLASVKQLAQ